MQLAVEFLTANGHDVVGLLIYQRMNRLEDLKRFYSLLEELEKRNGGFRMLSNCSGRMEGSEWPRRGVYFFYEFGENRTYTGGGLRVVRVGTHAVKVGAKSTLWQRLSRHKGITKTGGGNHRGSVFRLFVGRALINRNGYEFGSWGKGKKAPPKIIKLEQPLEIEVSQIICNMPFLWLAVEDDPGPNSLRRKIENNSIALLSNLNKPAINARSENWLGFHCDCKRICGSGLWNRDDTDEEYDAAFLDELERLIQQI